MDRSLVGALVGLPGTLLARRRLLLLGQDLSANGIQALFVEKLPELAVGHTDLNLSAIRREISKGSPNLFTSEICWQNALARASRRKYGSLLAHAVVGQLAEKVVPPLLPEDLGLKCHVRDRA